MKDIHQILKYELDWCIEHPDKELSDDYQSGFRMGLIQAMYLLSEADKQHMKALAFGVLQEQAKYHE